MSTQQEAPSDERLMELAEIIGIRIPPTEDDPRACSHAWGFALCPDVVQEWLVEALREGLLMEPEVPDRPNAFRFDSYLDWKGLAKAHPYELSIDDDWVPTSLCLDIVEELRAAGHDASLVVYAFVTGQVGRFPTFSIEASCIGVRGGGAGSVLAPYEDRIRAGLDAIAIPEDWVPAGLTLYEWEDWADWSFG